MKLTLVTPTAKLPVTVSGPPYPDADEEARWRCNGGPLIATTSNRVYLCMSYTLLALPKGEQSITTLQPIFVEVNYALKDLETSLPVTLAAFVSKSKYGGAMNYSIFWQQKAGSIYNKQKYTGFRYVPHSP